MALIQAAFGNHLLEELVLSSLRTMVLRTIILVSYTLIVSADTYVSLCTDVRIVRTCIRTYIHTCMRTYLYTYTSYLRSTYVHTYMGHACTRTNIHNTRAYIHRYMHAYI